MFESIVIISLVLLLGLREVLNHRERQQLLDRIMARNYEEYTRYSEKPEENELEEYETEVINLEEAREDLMSPGA